LICPAELAACDGHHRAAVPRYGGSVQVSDPMLIVIAMMQMSSS
jgi:hypothetical protein